MADGTRAAYRARMSGSGYGARIPDDAPEKTEISRTVFDVLVVALMDGGPPRDRFQALIMLADEVPHIWTFGTNPTAARERLRESAKRLSIVDPDGALDTASTVRALVRAVRDEDSEEMGREPLADDDDEEASREQPPV